jgi:hypothetical protein
VNISYNIPQHINHHSVEYTTFISQMSCIACTVIDAKRYQDLEEAGGGSKIDEAFKLEG